MPVDEADVSTGERKMMAPASDVFNSEMASSSLACTTRAYTFDVSGNKTKTAVRNSDTAGGCGSGTETAKTWSYNHADQILTTGSRYDPLGRQTLIAAPDSPNGHSTEVAYYDDDSVQSLRYNGVSTEMRYDPVGRKSTSTTTEGNTSTATSYHYSDDLDSPAWITSTVGLTSAVKRIEAGISGGISVDIEGSVATINLVDPQGNVVTRSTVPQSGNSTTIAGLQSYDEFGNTSTSSQGEYGWHGGSLKETDSSGFVQLGARLYNPVLSRFTTVDPIPGGNENPYSYPTDPVNEHDVSGQAAPAVVGLLIGILGRAVVKPLLRRFTIKSFSQGLVKAGKQARYVPYPTYKTFLKYAHTYRSYGIYRIWTANKRVADQTWKFGITAGGTRRPQSQLSGCKTKTKKTCGWYWISFAQNYYYARLYEAELISAYRARNGHCPPGQYFSCR